MRLIRFIRGELVYEAQMWVDSGVVDADTANKILTFYDLNLDSRRTKSTAIAVLASVAAFFMGLGMLLFISRNWEEIPRAIRLGGLVGLTALTQATGVWLYSRAWRGPAVAAMLLGSFAYGSSIFLIAQMYHLGEHFPDGVFYWALGVLPLALICESSVLMVMTAALATLWQWLEMYLGVFPGKYVFSQEACLGSQSGKSAAFLSWVHCTQA